MAPPGPTPTYEILGVLGRGGFGTVYRARLRSGDGFTKDVAIKLLTEADPGEAVLRRFRDESRILGLLRDRAIVAVDPPARLDGRWAIIMECVDGASAAQLVRSVGPFPPRVALQVVQEVARALHHASTAPGPSGAPLELVHRDLKPGNLQITPQGQVKVLDFGTARARFDAREAQSTRSIAGTYGYIAPERLLGEDTAAGDIYSLGMVLHRILTRRKPSPENLARALTRAEGHDALHAALSLATAMTRGRPDQRPSARDVEERCEHLVSRHPEGPTLRRWAPDHVSEAVQLDSDELSGRILTTGTQVAPAEGRRGRWWMGALVALNTVTVLAALAALATAGVAIAYAVGVTYQGPATAAPTLPPVPVAAPAPEPGLEPEPEPEEAEVVPTEPERPAAPARRARPAPAPAPAPPPPPNSLHIASDPSGVAVFVDGTHRGVTPLNDVELSPGTHKVELMLPRHGLTTRWVEVGNGHPNDLRWTGDGWTMRTRR